MDRCVEKFALERFRDLLGVPPGAYERGNDFIKRVIEPAILPSDDVACRRAGSSASEYVRLCREAFCGGRQIAAA